MKLSLTGCGWPHAYPRITGAKDIECLDGTDLGQVASGGARGVCVCDSSVAKAHRLRFGEVLFPQGKLGVITRSSGVGARWTEKPDVHIQRRWVS